MNNLKNKIISSLILVLIFILILSLLVCFNVNYKNTNNRIEILGADINNNQQNDNYINNKINNNQKPLVKIQNNKVNLSDYENSVVYLINTTRVSNGLNALAPNQILTDISRNRSSDMIARNYFSHFTPEGKNILIILKENGVSYSKAGENLAQSMPAYIGSPEAFMNAWMNSPSHAANILRNGYGMIGVGFAGNGGRRVLTVVFKNF